MFSRREIKKSHQEIEIASVTQGAWVYGLYHASVTQGHLERQVQAQRSNRIYTHTYIHIYICVYIYIYIYI